MWSTVFLWSIYVNWAMLDKKQSGDTFLFAKYYAKITGGTCYVRFI